MISRGRTSGQGSGSTPLHRVSDPVPSAPVSDNAQPSPRPLVPPASVIALSRDRAAPGSLVFRARALEAQRRGEALGPVLSVTTPSHWMLFATLAAIAVIALLLAFVGRVEITSRGRGIMRPSGGVQSLRADVVGLVRTIHVHSGGRVKAGQALVEIDASDIRDELAQAERRLSFVQRQLAQLEARDRSLHEVEVKMLRERALLARRRVQNQREQVSSLERRKSTYVSLGKSGLVAELDAVRIGDELGAARRDELSLLDELARTQGELGGLERSREQQLWLWSEERYRAQAELQRAQQRLQQTVIRAPRAGLIEALIVKPGERLERGALVAKLVAEGPVTEVVAYLPEKDRAFVTPGQRVRLELDRLPMEEFGAPYGRVVKVADEMADRAELLDTLGHIDDALGPVHRVDLTLIADARTEQVLPRLRSGALLSARFKLRERRLLALIFDPLRRWLE